MRGAWGAVAALEWSAGALWRRPVAAAGSALPLGAPNPAGGRGFGQKPKQLRKAPVLLRDTGAALHSSNRALGDERFLYFLFLGWCWVLFVCLFSFLMFSVLVCFIFSDKVYSAIFGDSLLYFLQCYN